MMFRFVLPVLLAAVCGAQEAPSDLFTRAPKGVDEALRSRIGEFYQLHMDGKFRQAEALVAEDTKDFFYSANKPKYFSYEIRKIEYAQDFTTAKATVILEQFVMIPGFADKPLKVPVPSYWKLEKGKWCWYVDQAALRKTPFGESKLKPGDPGKSPLPSLAVPASIEASGIQTQVKVEKSSVVLEGRKPTRVIVTNEAPGPVTLGYWDKTAGLDVRLDRTNLKKGETAVLTIARGDANVGEGLVRLRVDPTNQIIDIRWVDATVVSAGAGAQQTPFGPRPSATGAQVKPPADVPPQAAVVVDPPSVLLDGYKPVQVTLTNPAPRPVTLSLADKTAGLDVRIEKPELKGGEKTVVRIARSGANVLEGVVQLRVDPTNQLIVIRWGTKK